MKIQKIVHNIFFVFLTELFEKKNLTEQILKKSLNKHG